MSHYVYMLLCKGNRIYTGYATDVQMRYKTHCAGKGAKFTRAFPPIKILKVFELETKHDAMRLEALIKQRNSEEKQKIATLPDKTLPDIFVRQPREHF